MADLVTPMTIRVAVTLRVFDRVFIGVNTLKSLTESIDANPRLLRKVLAHLCAMELLSIGNDGRYQLTGLGLLLVRDQDDIGLTNAFDLESVTGRLDMTITDLLYTVRTGDAAYRPAFGEELWQHLDSGDYTADSLRTFVDDAHVPELDVLVHGYDWGAVERVVDVGGNTGSVAAALLRQWPGLAVTLLDLRCFTELATSRLGHFSAERCTITTQSFFDRLPDGEAFLLSGILADWSDDYAGQILGNCAAAAGARGRVIVSDPYRRVAVGHGPVDDDRCPADLR